MGGDIRLKEDAEPISLATVYGTSPTTLEAVVSPTTPYCSHCGYIALMRSKREPTINSLYFLLIAHSPTIPIRQPPSGIGRSIKGPNIQLRGPGRIPSDRRENES